MKLYKIQDFFKHFEKETQGITEAYMFGDYKSERAITGLDTEELLGCVFTQQAVEEYLDYLRGGDVSRMAVLTHTVRGIEHRNAYDSAMEDLLKPSFRDRIKLQLENGSLYYESKGGGYFSMRDCIDIELFEKLSPARKTFVSKTRKIDMKSLVLLLTI